MIGIDHDWMYQSLVYGTVFSPIPVTSTLAQHLMELACVSSAFESVGSKMPSQQTLYAPNLKLQVSQRQLDYSPLQETDHVINVFFLDFIIIGISLSSIVASLQSRPKPDKGGT